MSLARAGSLLLVGAGIVAIAAIALVFAGQGVGLGVRGPGGIVVIAILLLLGLGSAILAVANSSVVLRSPGLRASLGILAVGAFMEAASAIGSASMNTSGLENMPLVLLMLGGGAMMLLGVAALAVTYPLARRHSV